MNRTKGVLSQAKIYQLVSVKNGKASYKKDSLHFAYKLHLAEEVIMMCH